MRYSYYLLKKVFAFLFLLTGIQWKMSSCGVGGYTVLQIFEIEIFFIKIIKKTVWINTFCPNWRCVCLFFFGGGQRKCFFLNHYFHFYETNLYFKHTIKQLTCSDGDCETIGPHHFHSKMNLLCYPCVMLSTKIHVFTENNLRALLNWSEDAQLELCEHRTVSNGPRKGGGLISKKKFSF